MGVITNTNGMKSGQLSIIHFSLSPVSAIQGSRLIWAINVSTDDRNQAPEDGVNMKMPKVFVSWGKHATFREKCGGSHGYCCCALGDILSENLPWAQRSDDYYYVAEEGKMKKL